MTSNTDFTDKPISAESQSAVQWYVLRCYFGKELALRQKIEQSAGIECFVPIEKVRQRGAKGRFVWTPKCALTGYLFVHCTREQLFSLTRQMTSVHTMVEKRQVNAKESLLVPVVVRDNDMASFIRVSGSEEQQATYLDPAKLNLTKGDMVRVIGGPFVGVEGHFVQIGGKHEKRVVIQVTNFLAVATAAVPAALVEKI